ncbi:MAG: serine/threonine protein kinase [Myxococcales bacterium]|nr:serine/threonine protein kinase [Myxococcales bacterium]
MTGASGGALCPNCLTQGPRSPGACTGCGEGRLLRGRYWIDAVLGGGRTTQTLRATIADPSGAGPGAPVVIKTLSLAGARDWKQVELFERAASVLRGVAPSAPGIPRLVDHFEQSRGGVTRYYLVQEWIGGRSLAQLLEDGERFDEASARALAEDLLGTLERLHGFSPPVVHRDIKPANIIRQDAVSSAAPGAGAGAGGERDDDAPARPRHVLVDFDLVQDTVKPEGGSTMALGTAGYSPIEQLMGQAVPASDLHALGATLIALLSRASPTELYDPATQRVEFRERVNVSPELATVLERMVAPTLAERFSSAADVLRALRGESPATPTAVTPRPQRAALDTPTSSPRARLAPVWFAALIGLNFFTIGAWSRSLGLMIVGVLVLFAAGLFAARRPRRDTPVTRGPVERALAPADQPAATRTLPPALPPDPDNCVVLGRGLRGVDFGRSTYRDALEIFGADCTVHTYDRDSISGEEALAAKGARIWEISYARDAKGEWTPDRPGNERRPSAVQINSDTGLVTRLDIGVYQRALYTREGLHRASTRAEMIALYGEPDRFEDGDPLSTYEYARGLEVWISKEHDAVNSFRVRAPT